jgi:hypothetical protein
MRLVRADEVDSAFDVYVKLNSGKTPVEMTAGFINFIGLSLLRPYNWKVPDIYKLTNACADRVGYLNSPHAEVLHKARMLKLQRVRVVTLTPILIVLGGVLLLDWLIRTWQQIRSVW